MQDRIKRHDPFIAGLKERLPEELRETFTEEQLEALKLAFGTRSWGKHSVDLRGTVKFWHRRYYFVFLAGRNYRQLSRLEQELSLLGKATVLAAILLACGLVGLVLLYLLKSALGIDIFPDYSFGVWTWFKGLFE
ncbi:3-phosphoshikimate 1-carboxyvinyltransferase [Pseudomonas sp. MS15a(2019)]|uniref:3-phosphoshikimate 1-carboxyvinyltransferase n=1 Tax=Pseudomonas sp. MS15a(2019) TaxID=2579938 RepID=UPI0015661EBD|nr:3-phosphoshikimate 1-carboxyvinyltransferase [Pseudomonas sp. MS15a(2019)]NRH41213.1 3-phosphoshikimate 1-carboxyvinyltransferase [Pseudomonas sp. MS15a(2019)]